MAKQPKIKKGQDSAPVNIDNDKKSCVTQIGSNYVPSSHLRNRVMQNGSIYVPLHLRIAVI